MNYERLELIDGVTKWDAAKVQHLEDAIVKNENDIQKYHNDSVVEMQADWNQSDETAKDYIKNRTHYKEIATVAIAENLKAEIVDNSYEEGGSFYEEIDLKVDDFSSEFIWNYEEMDLNDLKVLNNGQEIRVTNCESDPTWSTIWYLENGLYIRFDSMYGHYDWWIGLKDRYNMSRVGEKFNLSIYTKDVKYTPLNDKFLSQNVWNEIDKGQKQSDWLCTDENDISYIKNRTHYDYYEQGEYCDIPYTFINNQYEGHWMGDNAFFVRGQLINAGSNWKQQDSTQYAVSPTVWEEPVEPPIEPVEPEEPTIDSEVSIYKWEKELGEGINKYTLDIIATVELVYDPAGWYYKVTLTSSNSYLDLYRADMKTKTLDVRFLPQNENAIVVKDWAVNDENDPAYIQNRTHYSYLDYGEKFSYYDRSEDRRINKLPKTEIIESYLSSSEVPGYWLGENKYLMNGKVIDAYSNWVYNGMTSEEEGYLNRFRYSIEDGDETFYIEANVGKSNWKTYNVTWTKFYGGWEGTFGKAATIYKTLDKNYIPEGFAQEVDWLEENSYSPSYIKNKPFYELAEKREEIFSGTIPSDNYLAPDLQLTGGKGTIYFVTVNGNTEQADGYNSREGDESYYGFYTSQLQVSTTYFEGSGSTRFKIRGDLTVPYTISIVQVTRDYELKQLNEKFIPNTIMRKDDTLSWSQINDQPFYDARPNGTSSVLVNSTYTFIGEHEEPGILKLENRYVKTWSDTASWENGIHPKVAYDYYDDEILYLGNAKLCSKIWSNGAGIEDTKEDYVIWWCAKYGDILHVVNTTLIYDPEGYYTCRWLEVTPPILKTLDDKFIPDTVARVNGINWSDIGEKTIEAATCANLTNINAEVPFNGIDNTTLIKNIEHTIELSGDSFYGTYSFVPDEDYCFTIIDNELYGIYNPEDNTYKFILVDDVSTFLPPIDEPEPPEEPPVSLYFNKIKIYREKVEYTSYISEKYIPDVIARAPKVELDYVIEAPTAEQYNALLDVLKQAGILA